MKIGIIGPGLIPIPPNGFGAVEGLIWTYYNILTEFGHEVVIFNTKDLNHVVETINNSNFDICHLHYDCYYAILDQIKCRVVTTSHYPRIESAAYWYQDDYHDKFQFFIENAYKYPIFAISEKDKRSYISAGVKESDIYLMTNGASTQDFKFKSIPCYPDKTVCLGQINPRKRQYLLSGLSNIDCIGRGPNIYSGINYIGEVTDEFKYNHLTDYGNAILVSDSENGTPLAVKECLAAGLGVVVSEGAAHELPRDLPFIRVLSEIEVHNQDMLRQAIEINRIVSLGMRSQIREWASQNFEWKNLIKTYEKNLKQVLQKDS